MASVQFHIHTDKENAVSSAHKISAGNNYRGRKILQTHKTVRQALGLVNEAHRMGGRDQVHLDLKSNSAGSLAVTAHSAKKTVFEKKPKLKQQLNKENDFMEKVSQQEEKNFCLPEDCRQPLTTSYCFPDIEYMPQLSDVTEDDDKLPAKERVSFYVHKLMSWRPQCLLTSYEPSDDEDEKEYQHIMEELDNLPGLGSEDHLQHAELELKYEECELSNFHVPALVDILLPSVDIDQD